MTLKQMIRSCEIFSKYLPKKWEFEGASHETFWGPSLSEIDPMSPEDIEELKELGWTTGENSGEEGWEFYF